MKAKAIRSAIAAIHPSKIAVAYVGKGWEKYISEQHLSEIVLSPTFGSNPKAIREIIGKLSHTNVHFLDRLHSKIYIGAHAAFLGSANLSRNGMSDVGLFESGVLVNDDSSLAALNAKFKEYRAMAKLSYPTKASKEKRLEALERQTLLAEWNGIPVDGSSAKFSQFKIGSERIHVAWFRAADLKYKADAISQVVPESKGKDPADYFKDEMNFRPGDDIREGDWILCWECKLNGKPKKNCEVSWMRVHHVIPDGVDEGLYTTLVAESRTLAQGAEPFLLDSITKGNIRRALEIGVSPTLMPRSGEDEEWSLPSVEHSSAFLSHVQQMSASKATTA